MHEFNSTAKYAFVKCQKTLGIDFLKNVLNKTITLNRVLTEAKSFLDWNSNTMSHLLTHAHRKRHPAKIQHKVLCCFCSFFGVFADLFQSLPATAHSRIKKNSIDFYNLALSYNYQSFCSAPIMQLYTDHLSDFVAHIKIYVSFPPLNLKPLTIRRELVNRGTYFTIARFEFVPIFLFRSKAEIMPLLTW